MEDEDSNYSALANVRVTVVPEPPGKKKKKDEKKKAGSGVKAAKGGANATDDSASSAKGSMKASTIASSTTRQSTKSGGSQAGSRKGEDDKGGQKPASSGAQAKLSAVHNLLIFGASRSVFPCLTLIQNRMKWSRRCPRSMEQATAAVGDGNSELSAMRYAAISSNYTRGPAADDWHGRFLELEKMYNYKLGYLTEVDDPLLIQDGILTMQVLLLNENSPCSFSRQRFRSLKNGLPLH